MNEILTSFWISFLCAAVLAYPTYRLLLMLKARQTISEFVPEHQQKQGTPTMGGLIVLPGVLLVLALIPGGIPAAVLVAGFALIGFLDDFVVPRLMTGKRGLGWKEKLVLEVLIAGGVSYWLFASSGWLDVALAAFIILFCSNAYNFADGMDGLAGGLLLCIAPAIIAVVNVVSSTPFATLGCAALMGGILPFLLLNGPPAKVFMGDVGALPIGALLGCAMTPAFIGGTSAIENHRNPIIALLFISLILIFELVPVPLQIVSVKLRKKRLFHRTPIHHSFQDKGWPETRVVATFLIAQLVFSVVGVSIAYGTSLTLTSGGTPQAEVAR